MRVISKYERVLICILDCTELTVLALISAIQAHEIGATNKHEGFCSLRKAKADYKLEIELVLPLDAAIYSSMFRTLIPSITTIWYGLEKVPSEGYDCIFDLSEAQARVIGAPTGKHLANSYGIMLGGEADSLPKNVVNLCQGHTESEKILTSSTFVQHCDAVGINLPVHKLTFRNPNDTLENRIRQSFECAGVLDFSCFESYLASTLHKKVIEYNQDMALTKWSSPNYYLLTELKYEALLRGITVCFPQLHK